MKVFINLQAIVVDETGLEDLMIIKNQLRIVDEGYQELKIQTPEWVLDKLSDASLEINMRVRAELQRQLKAAKARSAALKSRDERRKDADAEIAALEAKLV